MRAAILSREYPPDVYGGAGVHVEFLVRELRRLIDVDVHCWGKPREGAVAHEPAPTLASANPALQTLSVDLDIVKDVEGVDLVHSHTWYANMAGHIAALLYGIPHVITAHSLEPRRPWKREQLGGGYDLSSWVERTSYLAADRIIAVSNGMREDVLDCYPDVDPDKVTVIYNGIDADKYFPDDKHDVVDRFAIDRTRPFVIFVGRVTRQKGVPHLLAAAKNFDPGTQIVLCMGAADTPALAAEVDTAVAELQATRQGVVLITEMLPQPELRQLLSHATAFVIPSVYEPLGIVNLEAMACGTPVVGSAVGGIPEVVLSGETGLLVPYDPKDPAALEAGLAESVNAVVGDPARAKAMGEAGRRRAVDEFGWDRIARQTADLYAELTGRS